MRKKMVNVLIDAIVLTMLLACGSETKEHTEEEPCLVTNALYSHTVVYCGGYRTPDNIVSIHVCCDTTRTVNRSGCLPADQPLELEDCEEVNICYVSEWE